LKCSGFTVSAQTALGTQLSAATPTANTRTDDSTFIRANDRAARLMSVRFKVFPPRGRSRPAALAISCKAAMRSTSLASWRDR
jgi:hypothetical protein